MPPPPADPATQQASRLLRERVRTLFSHLPHALAGEEEAVHQLRVAGRRLRVALPLLAKKPGGKRVRRARRALRRLVGTAGRSRDFDVGLTLLEGRLSDLPEVSLQARRLRQRLRAARTRSHGRMVDALLEEEVPGVRRDLRRIQARGAEGFFLVLQRLRRSAAEEGGMLRATLESLGEHYDPPALHGARIRARQLRYTAELADRLGLAGQEAAASFKKLQTLLGAVQDGHVLAGWLAALAARAEIRGDTALSAEARSLEGHFRAASREHHAELLRNEPVRLVSEGLEALARRRSAA